MAAQTRLTFCSPGRSGTLFSFLHIMSSLRLCDRIPHVYLSYLPHNPHARRRTENSMSVGFQADRSAVGLNEPIGVSVVARNDSSATVKNVSIELVQETKFWARGTEDCSTRTLTSVVVPGTELAAVEVGGRRGQSAATIADTAQADLQQQLAAGAGSRHEIVVPGNTSLSFKSETIEVRHMLVVKLQTAGCVDAPDVWTPLCIQPGTTVPPESAVKVEAGSFSPSSAEAASFLSVEPVSVPQSAVKLQYSYEPAQPSFF